MRFYRLLKVIARFANGSPEKLHLADFSLEYYNNTYLRFNVISVRTLNERIFFIAVRVCVCV